MIRVIIVDDHAEIRNAWNMYLRSYDHIQVVGLCANGLEVMDKVEESHPDIVLTDINMKPVSGVEITRKLTLIYPQIKVIAVSFHTSPAYLKRMRDAGASGYVFKSSVAEDLIMAIDEVFKGNTFFSKGLKNRED